MRKEKRGWFILLTLAGTFGVGALGYWLAGILVAFFLAFLVFAYFVYFVLAPNNCCFTFVKEGTAKFVVKGDEFHRCLIQWKGFTFDYHKKHPETWNIIQGKEHHLFGGLRWYGLWPLYDILVYKFRWIGVTEEGKEQIKTEWLDYILVKDDVYLCKISAAEDKEKLPLDVEIFLTIRVANPYKAKFVAQRWLEMVLNRTQPLIRQFISNYSYEELLSMRHEAGGKMQDELEKAGLLGQKGEFLQRYGIDVRAIEIRAIEPPADWRAATLEKFLAAREVEGIITRAAGEKQAAVTRAEGEAVRISKIYGAAQQFGKDGFLLKIAEETKGKDVPALVITHHLAAQFEELLKKNTSKEALQESCQKLLEEVKLLEEMVKKA